MARRREARRQDLHDAVAPAIAGLETTWAGSLAADPLAGAFGNRASLVDKEGFEVFIEPLPGIAADAKSVEEETVSGNKVAVHPRSPFDPDYTKALVALEKRGDLSPPVRSPFGWHVILLIDRIPSSMLSLDERRAIFTDDIYDVRATKLTTPLLAKLHEATPTEIVHNADALLSLVRVGDDSESAQVAP